MREYIQLSFQYVHPSPLYQVCRVAGGRAGREEGGREEGPGDREAELIACLIRTWMANIIPYYLYCSSGGDRHIPYLVTG